MKKIITVTGSHAEWEVIETGITPGRILASGYREPDWNWVRVRRYDGRYPDFTVHESVSAVTGIRYA